QVLEAPAGWRAAAAGAALRVRAAYGQDVVCEQLEDLYADVVGARARMSLPTPLAPLNRLTGVSFVIPVHNGALRIRETLEAVLAQADSRPREIIVVDDRSDEIGRASCRERG